MNGKSEANKLKSLVEETLSQNRSATLATFSCKHPGFPFASIVNYCLTPEGIPAFLLSSMATHSKNLRANPNAALLVSSSNELSDSRLTLIGTVAEIPATLESQIRAEYLAANPEAERWIDFGDFQFLQLTVIDQYIVGGFGRMGWVSPDSA